MQKNEMPENYLCISTLHLSCRGGMSSKPPDQGMR